MKQNEPTNAMILERMKSLCGEAYRTVYLQHWRILSDDPNDDKFLMRRYVDFEFFILALSRLSERSRVLFEHIVNPSFDLRADIKIFNEALPYVKILRNVIEHISEYAVNKGHNIKIERRGLQVVTGDERNFTWLGHDVNIDIALIEADKLYDQILKLRIAPYNESRK